MEERCNLEGTRDYLYRILLHSECTYVFFEIRDYLLAYDTYRAKINDNWIG